MNASLLWNAAIPKYDNGIPRSILHTSMRMLTEWSIRFDVTWESEESPAKMKWLVNDPTNSITWGESLSTFKAGSLHFATWVDQTLEYSRCKRLEHWIQIQWSSTLIFWILWTQKSSITLTPTCGLRVTLIRKFWGEYSPDLEVGFFWTKTLPSSRLYMWYFDRSTQAAWTF